MAEHISELRLGIDLGSAAIKLVLASPSGTPLKKVCLPNRGRPIASLREALKELPSASFYGHLVKVAIAGGGNLSLQGLAPPAILINEVSAVARAVHDLNPAVRTVIDLGGQFSKWILLGQEANTAGLAVDFAANGLCAAGSGAFLEQQASRMGVTQESLGEMAASAAKGATIAGRCSVFAKSDMIHLQQKGAPLEEIAFGLCQALVRTFVSTIMPQREVEPPVALIGGGAANPGLIRAFREVLRLGNNELLVLPDPLFVCALGASGMAESGVAIAFDELLVLVESWVDKALSLSETGRSILPPLRSANGTNSETEEENPAPMAGAVDAYLGIDVGSVSTNLVLLSPDFKVLQGIYLPTAGRPVEALNQGLFLIRARFGDRLHLLGVGSTGSGRHLAAKLVGADVVHNEITAQTVSSVFYMPEVDTIFEIGGQDSKYIFVRDGQMADFEMNKICAGGTGSFLEEQAHRLGIRIIGEFAALALKAAKPRDLGTRCTVFMESELVRAQELGVPLDDICAGLAYSIARNYLEKVVAGRPVGRCIVFQGGTASNNAVVAAFGQLLGRPVFVHPYNRISGAIGAALLAARAKTQTSHFLGLESCSDPQLRSFECRKCENRCQVSRIQIGARIVHFGDVCERYAERDRPAIAMKRPFPELFAARERLFAKHLSCDGSGKPDSTRLGLLRASLNMEFLPFWLAFLKAAGYVGVISGWTHSAQIQEFARGMPAEMCLPIKIAAAQARELLARGDVDRIFVPTLLECLPRGKEDQTHTCFYAQQLSDMLRVEMKDRVIGAQFALRNGILGLLEPILKLAQALNRPADIIVRALAKARSVQESFASERVRMGRGALQTAFDRAVVVIGRPYNTHDPFLNLSIAQRLEQIGLPAIPWDLLPLEDVSLDARWQTVPWHYSREQLRTVELIRRDARLFPVMISSYGCGPDAFVSKHIEELLAGRPRLLLEFDEHRGEAGLMTRLEAFSDEIEEHLKKRRSAIPAKYLTPGPRPLPSGRRFFVPNFAIHARVYAAVLRSAGHEVHLLPPSDEDTIHLGEAHASGRECHPYAILGGELIRRLHETYPEPGDVFFLPSCATSCLLRQYGDAFRIMLEREGLPKIEIWEAATAQLGQLVGMKGLLQLYEGLLAMDILWVLSARLRPYEIHSGMIDKIMAGALERIEKATSVNDRLEDVVLRSAESLWGASRKSSSGNRPVIGITGDLYTRNNPLGNADLFHRLEGMGCEVWPSPFFADVNNLIAALEVGRQAGHWNFKQAALEGLAGKLISGIRNRLIRPLPKQIRDLAVEPCAQDLVNYSQKYVGAGTNYLILLIVAKIVDFLKRGASGVINASAINCMVGTAASAIIPSIRADFKQAPVITILYGGVEGPSQRLRLETFVHQVHQRRSNFAA